MLVRQQHIGKEHYGSLVEFTEARAFKADTYVIMLGTNDAVHARGEPLRVAPGLSELILSLDADALAAGPPEPTILIVLPPGAKPGSMVKRLEDVIHPAIVHLARGEGNATALDPKPLGKALYQRDMVHFNIKGMTRIAQIVANAIC